MPDNRSKVLEMIEDGMIDKDRFIQDALNWMSDDDVAKFCHHNEFPMSYDEINCEEDE
ncbi:MAG: hypothetical protein KAS32_13445 [Candidatus Peribacteraceae bacterium]|nr:hypothetical protein [Candidatus Peribacteraceae bacterium]